MKGACRSLEFSESDGAESCCQGEGSVLATGKVEVAKGMVGVMEKETCSSSSESEDGAVGRKAAVYAFVDRTCEYYACIPLPFRSLAIRHRTSSEIHTYKGPTGEKSAWQVN